MRMIAYIVKFSYGHNNSREGKVYLRQLRIALRAMKYIQSNTSNYYGEVTNVRLYKETVVTSTKLERLHLKNK